jgi:cellulose synthase/poly-beta-1,6-N-acetylglucosamine synthase-like glycosyltransferase
VRLTRASVLSPPVLAAVVLFWISLAALVWTHAVYPAAAMLAARLVSRPPRKAEIEPTVTVVIAAHNEEAVIGRRIENLLQLDYPSGQLRIVVTSDASADRTEEIAASYAGVTVLRNPRGGKVAAQDRAVRAAGSEIVAFSDANATWAPDAVRKLVRSFADPDVAYVCGQLRILRADGSNREGAYWRYEMLVRAAESALASVTGGNGSIYAVRRGDYVEVDPRFGHDLSFPYLMVQRGRRAVYEPEAHAFEKPTPTNETVYRRKVRMFEHCWLILLRGRMLRRLGFVYGVEIASHRVLRYGSGILHLVLLGTSIVLVTDGWMYDAVLAAQVLLLAAAAAGVGIARYYVLVTWATVVALRNYLRRGVPATWEAAEGTR